MLGSEALTNYNKTLILESFSYKIYTRQNKCKKKPHAFKRISTLIYYLVLLEKPNAKYYFVEKWNSQLASLGKRRRSTAQNTHPNTEKIHKFLIFRT